MARAEHARAGRRRRGRGAASDAQSCLVQPARVCHNGQIFLLQPEAGFDPTLAVQAALRGDV